MFGEFVRYVYDVELFPSLSLVSVAIRVSRLWLFPLVYALLCPALGVHAARGSDLRVTPLHRPQMACEDAAQWVVLLLSLILRCRWRLYQWSRSPVRLAITLVQRLHLRDQEYAPRKGYGYLVQAAGDHVSIRKDTRDGQESAT
ncbi:hypothetical protein PENSPDRAFT_206972 [Peniophora sp. CONT]|nr:hypothetical protein PENSPDRAFT_206972 [Peniophora sp. CONT]